MADYEYDIAVLGSGPGGYVAAARAAQLGASVALVEARELGGVCLNRGCIPTKALLECAGILLKARRAAEYGVRAENVAPDFPAMMARKDRIVGLLRGGVEALLARRKVEVIRGRGRLLDRDRLAVRGDEGETVVRAAKIIIATGSEPAKPRLLGLDEETVLTSDGVLGLKEMPESVLIIGGGYIGCEYAGFFSALGVKVTVVEMLKDILSTSDVDVAREVARAFRKRRIKLHLGAKIESVEIRDDKVTVRLSSGDEVAAARALVAVGRVPSSGGIGLEEAGVAIEEGAVVIDEHCRTNVPGVYAIGDVTGGIMLAHVAGRQALVAAADACGEEAAMDYRVVPSVFFTMPQVGAVGLTEQAARDAGHEIKCARFPYTALGKAHAIGETDGFFKIVADAASGEVLGVHIVGAEATDLIAEAALAMQLECTVEEIAGMIHGHPTLHEGMMEAAHLWLNRPIHG